MFLVALGSVRAVQRAGRGGAEHRGCSSSPGWRRASRRVARPAELGADPAAVPGRRARAGVRLLRRHRRPLDRRRPDRAGGLILARGRRARRLALDLPGQRADRRRGPAARRAAAPADGEPGPDRAASTSSGVGLLGGGVLACHAPAGAGRVRRLARLWWLFPRGALLLAGFVWWERRVVARAAASRCWTSGCSPGPPATRPAPASARSTSSGSAGSGWCSPCTCSPGWASRRCSRGLSVTPFALGAAASAVVGGRLVTRLGRRPDGIGPDAWSCSACRDRVVILLAHPGGWSGLVDGRDRCSSPGIGGGWVISPNTTMTLECVPGADGRLGGRGAADRAAHRRPRSAPRRCGASSTRCSP